MVPEFPLKVNTVLFVPVHTVFAPAILPATDVEFIVIVTLDVVADVQTPLVTTAR